MEKYSRNLDDDWQRKFRYARYAGLVQRSAKKPAVEGAFCLPFYRGGPVVFVVHF